MRKLMLVALGACLAALASNASPILWDINVTRNGGNVDSDVSDFVDLGIIEDLSGATVQNVTFAHNTPLNITTNGVAVASTNGNLNAYSNIANLNDVLKEYLFSPADVQISGLNANLDDGVWYALYLFGVGDQPGQSTTFTFDGKNRTTSAADPKVETDASKFVVRYTFTKQTGVDTLDFSYVGYFNGFAIVEAEPTGPILWDIQRSTDTNDASLIDFVNAGVTEDISGGTVSIVEGTTASNSTMVASSGITLTYTGTLAASGVFANTASNVSPVIREYVYFNGESHREMQIAGLSDHLAPNTFYSFYLWGVGDQPNQCSKFIYDGTTIEIPNNVADPDTDSPTNFVAKFSFFTGTNVSDTLDFEWHRQATTAALNGFAIVEADPWGPILWDINSNRPGDTNATVADFVSSGVMADLTGATVSHVLGTTASNSTMMAENGVTLSYVGTEFASGTFDGGNPANGILKEYIYFQNGSEREMQIGGLAGHLDSNSEYTLYIWGVGDSTGQASKFVFNGETVLLDNSADPQTADPTNFLAKFSFSTSNAVPDTLDFEWHRQGSFAGLNGFAIVKSGFAATSNGTPYSWLDGFYDVVAEFGGDYEAADLSDTDGDGLLAWEEYRCGTDPTDPSSVLAVSSTEVSGGNIVITWPSVVGVEYSIITNLNLVTPNPGVEVSGIVGLPIETSYTGTVSGADSVFYEVGVE